MVNYLEIVIYRKINEIYIILIFIYNDNNNKKEYLGS
jgi:hypothetical protein